LPTYTYACTVCGAEIERRQSFSDAPLTTCESCSGALRRVLHPVGVIFKGSGFYNTDYKNKSAGNGGGMKDDAESKTGESKPAEPAAAASSSGDAAKSTPASTSTTGSGSSPSSSTSSGAPAAAS
jgi:putative FmdB family regulatory protein